MSTLAFRWHSRAGQGAVTTAGILAEVLGGMGKYVQSFPEFGAEKRGAPVVVFNRISEEKITIVSQPQKVDGILLLDSTLVSSGEVEEKEIMQGIKLEGKLLINTKQQNIAFTKHPHIFTLDASGIAQEEIGKDIPNVPMLGALIRVFRLADLDEFVSEMKGLITPFFSPKIVAGNINAFKRGFYNSTKL